MPSARRSPEALAQAPGAPGAGVYSILQCLDHDRSGFVDKEEFINAVMNARAPALRPRTHPPRRRLPRLYFEGVHWVRWGGEVVGSRAIW